jgi:UDP-glucose pyrophosphorylase (EC 2.7.7.9)
MSTITKGVITAAGLGTRLLPATKNVPKEMLPILNKPMIHYVVEQFVEAGILENNYCGR